MSTNKKRKDFIMYRISDKNKNTKKVRWVLLEQLPTILSPKMLILVFLYAMAFTLLLLTAHSAF